MLTSLLKERELSESREEMDLGTSVQGGGKKEKGGNSLKEEKKKARGRRDSLLPEGRGKKGASPLTKRKKGLRSLRRGGIGKHEIPKGGGGRGEAFFSRRKGEALENCPRQTLRGSKTPLRGEGGKQKFTLGKGG